ncbi:MAG: hypothetical protein ACTSPE_12475 [Candidatus Thorarchaeota archaeon]
MEPQDRENYPRTGWEVVRETLECLGIDPSAQRDARLIRLIRVMLQLQEESSTALRFGDIYNALRADNPRKVPSKACIHRDLKDLTELELVRFENPSRRKKRYIINVDTIAQGLEHVQKAMVRYLTSELETIKQQLEKLQSIDCSKLAEDVVYELIGKRKHSGIRFARGVDGMHTLILSGILASAGPGDVVRTTAMFIRPLVEGALDRSVKFVRAAQAGADVRYLITSDLFRLVEEHQHKMDFARLMAMLKEVQEIPHGGGSLHLRVHFGPKTYNHVSLNRERVALILTEEPIATTLVTREFNPDLVDNVIDSFDESWDAAVPLYDLTDEHFGSLGLKSDNLFVRALQRMKQGGE